jgi:hypothetical protein
VLAKESASIEQCFANHMLDLTPTRVLSPYHVALQLIDNPALEERENWDKVLRIEDINVRIEVS